MPPFISPLSLKRRREDCDSTLTDSKRPNLTTTGQHETNSRGHGKDSICWMVQWRNPQHRKHKTWDGDGVLVVEENKATLHDVDGKVIAMGKAQPPFSAGKNFTVGNKELELDCQMAWTDFSSGKCFGNANIPTISSNSRLPVMSTSKKFTPPVITRDRTEPGRSFQSSTFNGQSLSISSDRLQCSEAPKDDSACRIETYWVANWREHQAKKHKVWTGDAFISQANGQLTMISEDGKIMGSIPWRGQLLRCGLQLNIGGKEVEIDREVSKSQIPLIATGESCTIVTTDIDNQVSNSVNNSVLTPDPSAKPAEKTFIPPASFYAVHPKPKLKGPLYDPNAEGAVVMKSPSKEHAKRFNTKNLPVVPVVLDPILARRMRPHQIEGVKFMYECVMGLRKHEGQGCILADEMGLGKTLQTIGLIWTLLKQNPYASGFPVVQKILVVCPVSLVNNWKNEFHKWLGKDRVGVCICDKNKVIPMFTNGKTYQILILGYERLRTVINELAVCVPPIGLIICDEGHRLKSANNKTTSAFASLRTLKRIILSGTPIQNDLGEFHTMAQFCNPGLLDEYSAFRRLYENPILKSRTPDATAKEIELGEARSAQLLSVAKSFVLRREATILRNYLPPKREYVVFITPTALQLSIFSRILNPSRVDDLVESSPSESLALINLLTKISNSPILLKAVSENSKMGNGGHQTSARIDDMSLSGKLLVLSKMLDDIYENTDEKCVLVSHYTSTLNILEAYCKKSRYSYYRLDGQTPMAKRQEYVNNFNKCGQRSSFIFLLSSKAGGVGINLIGASRLFLVDSDWNPSHDLQSMARCHRDGQKRTVVIYRFLTAGAIDATRYFSIHPDTACNTHDLLDCHCDNDEDICEDIRDREGSLEPTVSDSEGPHYKGFVSASDIKPESGFQAEKSYLLRKKEGLASLAAWTHIGCTTSARAERIQDEILQSMVLSQIDQYQHNSKEERLYEASISFLFERNSGVSQILDEDEQDSGI
ncbi:SNF2 family N-terminal domain-containing protein [Cyathus striatus]|nr:SNF2 family N-terminal domain-containing protein [Cyathus striatus]